MESILLLPGIFIFIEWWLGKRVKSHWELGNRGGNCQRTLYLLLTEQKIYLREFTREINLEFPITSWAPGEKLRGLFKRLALSNSEKVFKIWRFLGLCLGRRGKVLFYWGFLAEGDWQHDEHNMMLQLNKARRSIKVNGCKVFDQ